jgi:hypothetical protein
LQSQSWCPLRKLPSSEQAKVSIQKKKRKKKRRDERHFLKGIAGERARAAEIEIRIGGEEIFRKHWSSFGGNGLRTATEGLHFFRSELIRKGFHQSFKIHEQSGSTKATKNRKKIVNEKSNSFSFAQTDRGRFFEATFCFPVSVSQEEELMPFHRKISKYRKKREKEKEKNHFVETAKAAKGCDRKLFHFCYIQNIDYRHKDALQ